MRISTPRAYIIRMATTQDLIDFVIKLKLPNEKTPLVKNNRDYRVFARTEFHAYKSVKDLVNPSAIEKIFPLNPIQIKRAVV